MVWLEFLAAAALITFASIQLSKYGDVIGLRTKLGGAFAGTLLLAGATSLPELLTTISAVRTGVPDLAAGNLFGSNMFNIMLLGILDMVHYRRRISRKRPLFTNGSAESLDALLRQARFDASTFAHAGGAGDLSRFSEPEVAALAAFLELL